MPPPGPQPPRRHPDFAKDQPYGYNQPRTPMYGKLYFYQMHQVELLLNIL